MDLDLELLIPLRTNADLSTQNFTCIDSGAGCGGHNGLLDGPPPSSLPREGAPRVLNQKGTFISI